MAQITGKMEDIFNVLERILNNKPTIEDIELFKEWIKSPDNLTLFNKIKQEWNFKNGYTPNKEETESPTTIKV